MGSSGSKPKKPLRTVNSIPDNRTHPEDARIDDEVGPSPTPIGNQWIADQENNPRGSAQTSNSARTLDSTIKETSETKQTLSYQNSVARTPLRFDQNNISSTGSAHRRNVTVTSPAGNPGNGSVGYHSNHVHGARGVSGNRPKINQGENSSLSSTVVAQHFNKSQNFYKGKSGPGRSSGSGSGNAGLEAPLDHMSGIYNRHVAADPAVAALLKKDKFTLLGSQLQQQESQIFSRSLNQKNRTNGSHNLPYNSSSAGAGSQPSPFGTSSFSQPGNPQPTLGLGNSKFDPGKFRRVNERDGGQAGVVVQSDCRRGAGPLDQRDEELIASIEREFDFSY